ncbi:MAG: hypothetical protein H6835_09175 [Planctomycetes bacterium]|nr:hypothetical protein [Planctomycetota bacterium]
MKPRLLVPFLSALLAGALTAQSCAHERARTIPASIDYQLFMDCGGIQFRAPGLTFDTGTKGCPLLALYTPEHEIAEPTTAATKVVDTDVVCDLLLSFTCERDWVIFIPIGSKCVHTRTTNGGVHHRRKTVDCMS